MSAPKNAPPPGFPTSGVTDAGQALSSEQMPPVPQTPPVDPARVNAVLNAPVPGQAPPADADANTVGKAPAPSGPILLVDDDFMEGMMLADALAESGLAEVRTAMGAPKAQDIIAEGAPCLAVLALALDAGEGAEIAAALVALSIPMILIADDAAQAKGHALALAHPAAPVLPRNAGAVVGLARTMVA